MKTKLISLSILAFLLTGSMKLHAHCEVPCGIYGDEMRVGMIKEHIATIEKAMVQIDELSAASPVNYNQLVRWISTKEDHANQLQEIASQYFLTQRLKPADPSDQAAYQKYITQLTLMHEIIILAMKAKQSTDLENISKLKAAVDKFEVAYFGHKLDEGHSH